MILTFPYHDPTGKFNSVFEQSLPLLDQAFSRICISITPPTLEKNRLFVDLLSSQPRFQLISNLPGTTIGDHYRSALHLAASSPPPPDRIYFGFIDRILYTSHSPEWKTFLSDLHSVSGDLTLFSRSKSAWSTHPANYRRAELVVISFVREFLHRQLDLNFCGLSLNQPTAQYLLQHSVSPSFNVAGEWLLLALQNHISVITKSVDWLSWEDPFWEHADKALLKQQRNSDPAETMKRLVSCREFLQLLSEDRFRSLLVDKT